MTDFILDQRLHNDCLVLGDFPLCRLLLMNDARYPWFILVPREPGVEEIYQLSQSAQERLLKESSYVVEKLKDIFVADKMNVAALGNIVRQLHVHIVVRKTGDDAWPGPVWGHGKAVPYTEQELEDIYGRLATVFTTWLTPVEGVLLASRSK